MPADLDLAEDLAGHLVTIYADLEQRLTHTIALQLQAGLDAPDWAQRKLAAAGQVRRMAERLTTRLRSALGDQVATVLTTAYARGSVTALEELALLQAPNVRTGLKLAQISDPSQRLRAMLDRKTTAGLLGELAEIRTAVPGADAILRLTHSLTRRLEGTHTPILRWAQDTYREVVSRTVTDVLAGVATRRVAAQAAWDRLLAQGVTGFVDRSGRRWNLASYVEMATRTSVAQAAVEGHLDRLAAAGLDLVVVSNAPQECERCRPWEGRVLARSGPAGHRVTEARHAITGRRVLVEIRGTVDEAVADGLLHPNCRHSLSAYLPGVTKPPTGTADPEGDEARQRLRALERRVRAEKIKAAAALDPAARRRHQAKVRELQGRIRGHVAATGLHRQPHREQINLGNRPGTSGPLLTRPKLPPPPPLPPKITGVPAGDFTALRRVGPQAGSNPGGLFEAPDGTRWYVKAAHSEEHARSEVLAADLYRAAGIDVPELHIGHGTPDLPDGPHIASRIIDTQRSLLDDDAFVAKVREGFAVDAWLGNWDFAGAVLDNIVTDRRGRPVRIDLGGSLTFRARGSRKGTAWGDEVHEWNTLRDPDTAPQAARLYQRITAAERVASVKRVEAVTPTRIRRLVKARDLPEDLANRLIARRADLLQRVKASEHAVKFEARAASAVADQAALDSVPVKVRFGQIDPAPREWSSERVDQVARSVRWYQGAGYERINDLLRRVRPTGRTSRRSTGEVDVDEAVTHIEDLMDHSKLPGDMVTWRGLTAGQRVFGVAWGDKPLVGAGWTEHGLLSVSADERVARNFSGASKESVILRILIPARLRGIRLSNMAPPDTHPSGVSQEAEILMQPGLTLRVVEDHGVVAGARRLDIEVTQT